MTENHRFHSEKRSETLVLNKFYVAIKLLLAGADEDASARKTVTAYQVQEAAISVRNPVQAMPL
jgi:hypothetical protein